MRKDDKRIENNELIKFENYIINRDDLDVIGKKSFGFSDFLFYFISLIATFISAIIGAYLKENSLVLWVVFFIFGAGSCIMYCLLSKKMSKGMYMELVKRINEKIKQTGICLITRYSGSGEIEFLVDKDDAFHYFTYVNLKKFNLEDEKKIPFDFLYYRFKYSNVGEIDEKKIEELGLGVARIKKIDRSFPNTKEVRDKLDFPYEQTVFKFYHVILEDCTEQDFTSAVSGQFMWAPLKWLIEKDKSNNLQNNDVLKCVKSLMDKGINSSVNLGSSFYNSKIKIIWNIASTEGCSQDCEICATSSKRKGYDNVDDYHINNTILVKLFNSYDRISKIDFSGGDPLLNRENRSIILSAIERFGKEKVNITTTRKGINCALQEDKENIRKYLYNVELTLDIVKMSKGVEIIDSGTENNEFGHRMHYNDENLTLFQSNKIIQEYATYVYINMPIVDVDVTKEDLETIVDNIAKIKEKIRGISILRLMKVGKCDYKIPENNKDYSKKIKNIIEWVKQLLVERDMSESLVQVHCALRGLYNDTFRCKMRDEKIGIDCNGNVFACAWGGYIDGGENYAEETNPFYLGNLLSLNPTIDTLDKIIEDSYTKGKIIDYRSRPLSSCSVYNYICRKKATDDKNTCNSIFVTTDFLYSTEEAGTVNKKEKKTKQNRIRRKHD